MMLFISYLIFIFTSIVCAIIQLPESPIYLFAIIFITYWIGVYSGIKLSASYIEMAKYTKTFDEKDEFPRFYIMTGFTPVMNVILTLFFFLNLKEINYFQQMKAQGSFYIPKPQRDSLNRMGQ